MTDQADPQPQGAFEKFADTLSYTIGRPAAFLLALTVVCVWAALGPFASFSTTWQLVINTGTTIVTFLMVFLLGNASNRITENQARMLANIFAEERQVEAEERLIRKLLDRIDVSHIRPNLEHLDAQDHSLESVAERFIEELKALRGG